MKRNKYFVVDLIGLLMIMGTIRINTFYIMDVLQNNKNSIYLAVGFSVICVCVYLIRIFFRPTYEDITYLRSKGWKITGYYSKYSLADEQVYNTSYLEWVKMNFVFLIAEFMVMFAYYIFFGEITVNELWIHVGVILIFQIVAWVITLHREKINDNLS